MPLAMLRRRVVPQLVEGRADARAAHRCCRGDRDLPLGGITGRSGRGAAHRARPDTPAGWGRDDLSVAHGCGHDHGHPGRPPHEDRRYRVLVAAWTAMDNRYRGSPTPPLPGPMITKSGCSSRHLARPQPIDDDGEHAFEFGALLGRAGHGEHAARMPPTSTGPMSLRSSPAAAPASSTMPRICWTSSQTGPVPKRPEALMATRASQMPRRSPAHSAKWHIQAWRACAGCSVARRTRASSRRGRIWSR